MLNRSDAKLENALLAGISAQNLRGGASFGGIAYCEKPGELPTKVETRPGYADCLPVLDGIVWQDPSSVVDAEVCG